MKYLIFFFLLISTLQSQTYDLNKDFTSNQASAFQNEENANSIEKNSENIFVNPTEQNLYLSYISFPEKIFKNQRFEIVLKAIVTTTNYDKIETKFNDSIDVDILNADSPWLQSQEQTYENRYFFKAYKEDFKIPPFEVVLIKDEVVVEIQKIEPKETIYTEIGKSVDNFSSIIAKNLVINAHKTKQYNNDELITIFDISATQSNLEDFYIKNVKEQGISSITDNYPEQELLYYLVLPVHTKKLDFSYYNTNEKRFVTVKVPIILENELVSTQTDLNPNTSNILFYKKVGSGVVFIILVVLYFIKKNKLYLIASLIALIVLLVYVMPNKTAILKKDSYIYILPTKKSTIFQKTNKDFVVEVSIKRGEFIKVVFNQDNNSLIGWVKEEDLVKN